MSTTLVIAGLVRMSTCDWPGRLVATVFTQGCPWRCTYCHNLGLLDPTVVGAMTWSEVRGFLERRVGLLDGVVFSGGEPTRQAALGAALREVRDLGFSTGLHTSGAYPRRLAEVIDSLDWVGLDIKAIPAEYPQVTGALNSADRAFASLGVVVASGVAHEVRITVDPTIHRETSIYALVELLVEKGAAAIVLQEARPEGTSPAYTKALAARHLRDVLASPPPGATARPSP